MVDRLQSTLRIVSQHSTPIHGGSRVHCQKIMNWKKMTRNRDAYFSVLCRKKHVWQDHHKWSTPNTHLDFDHTEGWNAHVIAIQTGTYTPL